MQASMVSAFREKREIPNKSFPALKLRSLDALVAVAAKMSLAIRANRGHVFFAVPVDRRGLICRFRFLRKILFKFVIRNRTLNINCLDERIKLVG